MDHFTFPLIALPPILSLSLDGQTGTEGSAITGTVVSLQGLATLANVVDSPMTVSLTWSRPDPNGLLDLAQLTNPPYTLTTTIDPISVGGVYEFIVNITPSISSFVEGVAVNASYIINLQPYPPLVIRETVRSGDCLGDSMATLTGSVSLLPNIATNHTLAYIWTGDEDEKLGTQEALVVNNMRAAYILTACLTIPGTNVMSRCITAHYVISTDG